MSQIQTPLGELSKCDGVAGGSARTAPSRSKTRSVVESVTEISEAERLNRMLQRTRAAYSHFLKDERDTRQARKQPR